MNLPNILTIMRIIMIPFFVGAFLTAGINDWITLAIFVIAYIVSPIDIAPAIPVDDIVVAIGGASYVLIPKND